MNGRLSDGRIRRTHTTDVYDRRIRRQGQGHAWGPRRSSYPYIRLAHVYNSLLGRGRGTPVHPARLCAGQLHLLDEAGQHPLGGLPARRHLTHQLKGHRSLACRGRFGQQGHLRRRQRSTQCPRATGTGRIVSVRRARSGAPFQAAPLPWGPGRCPSCRCPRQPWPRPRSGGGDGRRRTGGRPSAQRESGAEGGGAIPARAGTG